VVTIAQHAFVIGKPHAILLSHGCGGLFSGGLCPIRDLWFTRPRSNV
jgi:hypothetical protein